MLYTRSKINYAKHFFALVASLSLLSFSVAISAETLTTELSVIPETAPPDVLPGAIEIEGDKLNLYLDRKMRASGNAVISKGDKKFMATILNMTYKMMN